MKGLLVTFEGIDGSGKSTQVDKVFQALFRENSCNTQILPLSPIITHQPGGTTLGHELRKILKDSETEISSMTELFLFQADRSNHKRTIEDWLDFGHIILCDRYTDSTLAYQGYGRGLNLEWIKTLNHVASNGRVPDLTLLYDIAPEIAQRRMALKIETAQTKDRFDDAELEFHQKVRDGFLAIAKSEPERFLILNGEGSIGTLTAYATSEILKRLRAKQNA